MCLRAYVCASGTQDLEPLRTLPRLLRLVLHGNPVTAKPNYRLYVMYLCPNLKVLDYRKIKPKEREAARSTFEQEIGMLPQHR